MANSENTDNTEITEPTVRKTWQFGHFQTKHDGKRWRLVRTHDTYGFEFGADVGKIVASNKSATPLVALARELSRVEKRDIRLRKLRSQAFGLRSRIDALEAEIEAESAAAVEAA